MLKYAKSLKDLLTNKRKLEEVSTVTLSEGCSAIPQNKLSRKLKDLESCTLQCFIGNSMEERALADLSTNVNVSYFNNEKINDQINQPVEIR